MIRELAGVDRFGDVSVTAGIQGFSLIPLHRECGHGHNPDLFGGVVGFELAGQRQAIHARQPDIHQDQVRDRLLDRIQRLLGIRGLGYFIPRPRQKIGGQLEIGGVVVHHQDMGVAHGFFTSAMGIAIGRLTEKALPFPYSLSTATRPP